MNGVPDIDRARIGWWLFLSVLVGIAAFAVVRYFGAVVLGVFVYYATRPIHRHVRSAVGSDRAAAAAAVLGVVLPVLLVSGYAGVHLLSGLHLFGGGGGGLRRAVERYLAVRELTGEEWTALFGVLRNPSRLLAGPARSTPLVSAARKLLRVLGNAALNVGFGLTLGYFLLRTDARLADFFRRTVGGRETAAYAYATAVDADLEALYYGNLLFVVAMSVVSAAVYLGANAVAPPGLRIPMPLALAALTGAASLVPLVVGKLVYVPVVLYLTVEALGAGGAALWFPAAVLVACFLLLDVLPQTFLQPYITGRRVHLGLMMFAYVLGPLVFGWYGFFFLPLVAICLVQAARLVWLELVRGERLSQRVTAGGSVGSDPAVGPSAGEGDDS